MIPYYDSNGVKHPLTQYEDFYIVHEQDGFEDTLCFAIDPTSADYQHLSEEGQIEYANNNWIVKKISDANVEAFIDFDFLKSTVYRNYDSGSVTLSTLLTRLLNGYTILNGNITSVKRTIKEEITTPYEILKQAMSTYGVFFEWNTIGKKVTVHSATSQVSSGEYITNELNLKSLAFTGETTNFATRLYPYGNEGLTIESVNNGKEYVENYTYSNKIVCAYWTDDRYTVAENLKAAAEEKLAEMAIPVRTYECDVFDLAKTSPDKYSFLAFILHRVVTLVDTTRKIRVDHKIVQYKEYPDNPAMNTVTLSAVQQTISEYIRNSISDFGESLSFENNETSGTEEDDDWINRQIEVATAILTGETESYKFVDGGTTYIANNPNLQAATSVWRYNSAGVGHSNTGVEGPYTTAWTMDGSFLADVISAMTIRADRITTGMIRDSKGKNYWNLDSGEFVLSTGTKIGNNTVQQIANTAANSALESSQSYTESEISALKEGIKLSVSNGTTSSSITLSIDEGEQTATINMSGLVKFSDLKGNGTTEINGANLQTGTIDVSKINVSTIDANALNLMVGGDNLVSGTKTMSTDFIKYATTISATTTTRGEFKAKTFDNQAAGVGEDVTQVFSFKESVELQGNQFYILSFYANGNHINNAAKGGLRVVWNDEVVNAEYTQGSSDNSPGGTSLKGQKTFDLTSSYTRYWVKWRMKNTTDLLTSKLVFYVKQGWKVGIYGIKLEKGNVPTEWSYSSEEIADEISESKITALKDGLKISVADASGNAPKITLKVGDTQLGTPATIDLSGRVTFTDLKTSGNTIINGSNITTGTLDASKVIVKNLNASKITSGTLSSDRISTSTLVGKNLFGSTMRIAAGSSYQSPSLNRFDPDLVANKKNKNFVSMGMELKNKVPVFWSRGKGTQVQTVNLSGKGDIIITEDDLNNPPSTPSSSKKVNEHDYMEIHSGKVLMYSLGIDPSTGKNDYKSPTLQIDKTNGVTFYGSYISGTATGIRFNDVKTKNGSKVSILNNGNAKFKKVDIDSLTLHGTINSLSVNSLKILGNIPSSSRVLTISKEGKIGYRKGYNGTIKYVSNIKSAKNGGLDIHYTKRTVKNGLIV